ncbi:hypothetical protein EDC96DRAFT_68411 [Choanephora cucurbitarum]|nr:hypothetical protein EDC96DRAFT_68411 [Choanephora cucurbitarum]
MEYLDEMKEERRKLDEAKRKRTSAGLLSDRKKDLFERKQEYQAKRKERNSKKAKLPDEDDQQRDEEEEGSPAKKKKKENDKVEDKEKKELGDAIKRQKPDSPPRQPGKRGRPPSKPTASVHAVNVATSSAKTTTETTSVSLKSNTKTTTMTSKKLPFSSANFKPHSGVPVEKKQLAISKAHEYKPSFTNIKRPITNSPSTSTLLHQSVGSPSKLPNIPKYGPSTRPAPIQRQEPITNTNTSIASSAVVATTTTTAATVNAPSSSVPTVPQSSTIKSPVITPHPLPSSTTSTSPSPASPNRSPVIKQTSNFITESATSIHSPSVSPPQVFQTPPSSPPPPNQSSPPRITQPEASIRSTEPHSLIAPLNQQRTMIVSPRRTDPRLVVDNMRKLKIQNSTALPTPFSRSCILLKGN